MQGVTTALVAFLLACVIWPRLVKNRPQYYAAFAGVCLIILLDALGLAIGGAAAPIAGFRVFVYVACAGLQVATILLLFMSCGGLSWKELTEEMTDAYEVIRRGESQKEIIIPISGQKPKPRAEPEAPAERIPLDDPIPPAHPGEDKPSQP